MKWPNTDKLAFVVGMLVLIGLELLLLVRLYRFDANAEASDARLMKAIEEWGKLTDDRAP